jgi:hypothetical protein
MALWKERGAHARTCAAAEEGVERSAVRGHGDRGGLGFDTLIGGVFSHFYVVGPCCAHFYI